MTKDWITRQPSLPDQGESNRVIAVIMLFITGLIFRDQVIAPLNAAAHHDKSVSISNVILAVPFFFTLGLIFAVMGRNAHKIMGHPQKPSALGWSITAITLGLGFYLDYWMKCKLSDYGYNF